MGYSEFKDYQKKIDNLKLSREAAERLLYQSDEKIQNPSAKLSITLGKVYRKFLDNEYGWKDGGADTCSYSINTLKKELQNSIQFFNDAIKKIINNIDNEQARYAGLALYEMENFTELDWIACTANHAYQSVKDFKSKYF